jgi:choline dehydrogenase-like flavoprotein
MPDPDVLIIGAGMGGGASAYALTQRGLTVQLLDAGPAFNPDTDYRLNDPNWEAERFPQKPGSQGKYSYGKAQLLDQRWQHLRSHSHLYGFLNKDNTRKFNAYNHVRGIGGSTLHFTGEAHRLNPASMQMLSQYGVAADWPVRYEELLPFYRQAEVQIGVAGLTRNNEPCPQPAHLPSYADQTLGKGMEQLGLNWTPNSLAVLSQPHQGRPPCNYCAGCNFGCPRRDKGSADQTFVPAALATGKCEIRPGLQVLHLVAGKGDQIDHVITADPAGNQHKLRASRYVLAAGAVESPRLLLHSELGNESGEVGRNFMETLSFATLGLHPEPLGSHRGLPSGYICWDFNAPDAIPGVIGGCRLSPVTVEAGFFGASIYASRVIGGWGKAHKQAMRSSCGNVLGIGGIGDFLPNPDTFIDLDPSTTDQHGTPLARINSHLSEQDIRRIDFIAKKNREILQAAGVESIFEQYGSYDFFNSTHVAGTCRMGINPDISVVNSDLRHHRWKNLYIADASVFPSIGGGESPALTIAALALRMGASFTN